MSVAATYIVDSTPATYRPKAAKPNGDAKASGNFTDALPESVVDTFKRNHPDSAAHVDKQVRAGRSVREKNGGNVSTKDMTMEEYKAYFTALLNTIPYDPTRVNDVSTISITDKGWEQMKKDPDYEAWVLGYFVEDRSVRNPFFGWGNNDGCIIFEHFGASIEEHHGEGFSKAAFKKDKPDNDEDEEESWWIKRHKRMKKLIKEQAARDMKKNAAKELAAQEEFARLQYINSRRQHSFLTTGNPDAENAAQPEHMAANAAAAAYLSTIDLFSDVGSVN